MIWHTLERHLFPREKGRNILHDHTTKLPSLLPVLGRLTYSKQVQPYHSWSPCSGGTSGHFTHRNKALSPRGDETAGIRTKLKHDLQNIYREIWLFFSRTMPKHQWCLILPQRHGTIRQLYRFSQDKCKVPSVTGQRSAHYSHQNWLFILYNLCYFSAVTSQAPFGMLLSPWAEA